MLPKYGQTAASQCQARYACDGTYVRILDTTFTAIAPVSCGDAQVSDRIPSSDNQGNRYIHRCQTQAYATSEFLMSVLRVSGPRADALRLDAFMCIVHWDVYVALKRFSPTSDSQDSHYKGTRHAQRR